MAAGEADIVNQGRRLMAMGCGAVLIKGGRGQGTESVDHFFDADRSVAMTAPRPVTRNTHGTGCSLSAAIAAGLAKGQELDTAVREAKVWMSEAIAQADRRGGGHGGCPMHHFHGFY